MKTVKIANFFHDKPLFGLDIGHGSLKVMELADYKTKATDKYRRPRVVGYGSAQFDKAAQEDGVVTKPEVIAKAARELFDKHLIGDITTRRAAIAIPAYRTFTRSVQLPRLKPAELKEAVELEAEQYISLPLEELYLDYEIIKQTDETTELFLVAVPKTIVDSYLDLAQILGLEPVLIEPTLSSSSRLFSIDSQSDVAAFIIDFGSLSSDISIFDGHTLVTGTVQSGGEQFTSSIKSKLGVTTKEAALIKTKYGLALSKKQADIKLALDPTLQEIAKEIRRMMRYEERYGSARPISQIVTLGGGANMPGLSEYLTEILRLAVRHSDPWQYLDHTNLQPPSDADKPMYATVAGLSLANPNQGFSAMINLLPPAVRSNYSYGRRNVYLRHWVILFAIAFVGLGIIATYGLLTIRQSTVHYNQQIATTEALFQKEQYTATQKQIQDMSGNFKLVVKVLGQEVLFSQLLKQIAATIPSNASLTGLTIAQTKGGIDISAIATDYSTASQVQVNLADPTNKIFSKADILSITCGSNAANPRYPCTVNIRALFATNNPFLFINSKATP